MSRACLLPYSFKDVPEVALMLDTLKSDSAHLFRDIYTMIMQEDDAHRQRGYCALDEVMLLAGRSRYRKRRILRMLYNFGLFRVDEKLGRVYRMPCLVRHKQPTPEDRRRELENRDNSGTLFPRELDEMDKEALECIVKND